MHSPRRDSLRSKCNIHKFYHNIGRNLATTSDLFLFLFFWGGCWGWEGFPLPSAGKLWHDATTRHDTTLIVGSYILCCVIFPWFIFDTPIPIPIPKLKSYVTLFTSSVLSTNLDMHKNKIKIINMSNKFYHFQMEGIKYNTVT